MIGLKKTKKKKTSNVDFLGTVIKICNVCKQKYQSASTRTA